MDRTAIHPLPRGPAPRGTHGGGPGAPSGERTRGEPCPDRGAVSGALPLTYKGSAAFKGPDLSFCSPVGLPEA